MIVFNIYAVLSLGLGIALAIAIGSSSGPLVGILAGAAVATAIDLLQRLANRNDLRAPLVNEEAGGHVFYIPVWLLSVIGLFLMGLVKLGVFTPSPDAKPYRAAKNVAQKDEKPPPPVPQPRPELPKPPEKPPRPRFAEAVVKKIALDDGRHAIQDSYQESDAADRGSELPVKVYEMTCEADQAYWVEPRPPFGWGTHGVRIEDREGHILVVGTRNEVTGRWRSLFVPPRSDNYRIVVNARTPETGEFVLYIEELPAGDILAEAERLPPPDAPRLNFKIALQTEPFMSAAIAADCRSAWVAFFKGRLQRYSCPDFVATDTYQFPRHAYELAINGAGLLCAAVPRVNPSGVPHPWSNLGPSDIHLYDSGAFTKNSKKKGALKPAHVISVGGVIARFLISPDDGSLYYLDTLNNKVGRISLESGKLDQESAEIVPGTKAICLTPDGSALYACADTNVVQKLDPLSLQVEKTIRLDRGTPHGLQVTDRGDVFLRGDGFDAAGIDLINANRESGGEPARVMQWASIVFRQNSLVLSPDQTRLFTSCFHVSPSNIKVYHVPRWPAVYRAQECGAIGVDAGAARAGHLTLSRDGRFLFCDRGLILTLEEK